MTDILATLAEATYGEFSFPVSAVAVEGGHDFAEHTAYRRRGADMEPCGQKPYAGSFTIPCVNTPALVQRYGDLFTDGREAFVRLFEDVPIGLLTLPGYRSFDAAVKTWSSELSPDVRNGTDLKVTFTEHNATASLLTANGSPVSTPATVSLLASLADAAMRAYAATGWLSLATTIAEQLTTLATSALPYTAVSECFRRMLSPIAYNLALPLFASAAAHAATLALLNLQASIYDLQSRYQPTLSQARTYTVPVTMALWEIAQSVYGDASLTSLLRAANAISDPLLVKAGTVLTILPAP